MQLLIFPEAETPPHLRRQVWQLQKEAWPPTEPPTGDGPHPTTHDPALQPRSMLLVDGDGMVLAALDILSKQLTHQGRCFRAGGLSTVVTRTAARGRGHGRRLAAAAHQAMAASDLDLGLFTCDPPLQAFYESAGWRLLPGAALIGGTPQAPFPSDQAGSDKVTMADFFSTAAREARHTFAHSRIALHPGEIDKLW